MGSDSLSDDSPELVDARHGIRHLGVNRLLGVSGLFVGVGIQKGLVGECLGEGMGDSSGVMTGDGRGVSLGTRSGVDGCLGDQGGTCVSSPGVLSSPLSKGEIIGSIGIMILNLLVRSVGSSDCLLISLSLFSCSKFSSSFSLSLCRTMCCKMNSTYSSEMPSALGHLKFWSRKQRSCSPYKVYDPAHLMPQVQLNVSFLFF